MSTVYLEDVALDREDVLGAHRFEAADIVAFAETYDPQRFHLSEEGACDGIFGAISASGWHTTAVFMKLLVAHLTAKARAGAPLAVGPSPGFEDLRWCRPVLAGDTITYRLRPVATRASDTRPGWGILTNHATAVNQHGDLVFEMTNHVMMRTRPRQV